MKLTKEKQLLMIKNKLFKYFYFSFFVFLFSCNDSEKENDVSSSVKENNTITDTKYLAKRANYYYEQNEYLKAKLSYDTLLAIDSSKGGYYFKRAYSKSMLSGNDREAINDYLKAIGRNYSEKKTAYLNIGVLYRGEGKYDSAIHYYNECLKIDSNDEKAQQEKREVIELLKKPK